jgi:hypothetical protein
MMGAIASQFPHETWAENAIRGAANYFLTTLVWFGQQRARAAGTVFGEVGVMARNERGRTDYYPF